jgi:hypothetical protein
MTPLASVSDVLIPLAEWGYAVTYPETCAAPDAIATRETGSTPPLDWFGERPLALEALHTITPTTVVDRVAHAAVHGRVCLFVADAEDADRVRTVLTDPPCVEAVSEDGCRTFYHVPDRIRLGDAGYACVRTTDPLVWREEPASEGRDTRLVLATGGEVQAAFDDHTGLACPAPDEFPYAYHRGDDKRIHVTRDGRQVGLYSSIRAMKADAYQPVPDPLIPEAHLPGGIRLRKAWAVAVVEDGRLDGFVTAAGPVQVESIRL